MERLDDIINQAAVELFSQCRTHAQHEDRTLSGEGYSQQIDASWRMEQLTSEQLSLGYQVKEVNEKGASMCCLPLRREKMFSSYRSRCVLILLPRTTRGKPLCWLS